MSKQEVKETIRYSVTIHGREFPDVESLYWLADAVKEKLARQPDPDTGLVPCGCGGKAQYVAGYYNQPDHVVCPECGMETPYSNLETITETWNRAMGYVGATP